MQRFCDFKMVTVTVIRNGAIIVTMLTIRSKDLLKLENDLRLFAKEAFPYAEKATLNSAAFETRTLYQREMQSDLTLRNQWTTRSAMVEKAKLGGPSRVGSIAPYMADQEFGATSKGKSGGSKPIPTTYAAGMSASAAARTKAVRRRNWQPNIKAKRRRGRVGLMAAVQDAVNSGQREIYLDGSTGQRKGLYRVVGGRRVKRGWPKGAKLRMIWDLSRDSVRIKRTPLLSDATAAVVPRIPDMYAEAIRYQLRRRGLFERR